MVRGLKLSFLGGLMAVLASCAPATPTPTPLPTNTPIPPSATPIIVTIDASGRQVPATWTPAPTDAAAISTRRPTSTLIASATLTETPGPFKGQLGVLNDDHVISVALTRDDLEAALATERSNALYSSIVSSAPKVTFANRAMRLAVVLNNYTTEGLRSEIDFGLRAAGRRLRADITGNRTERGTLLTPTQLAAVRDMLNAVLENVLAIQLTQANIPFEDPQVLSISVEESRIVVTAKLKLLPTPTEGPSPTETPTEIPSATPFVDVVTTETPAGAASVEGSTTTPADGTSAPVTTPTPATSATQLPTILPTLFPSVTPT